MGSNFLSACEQIAHQSPAYLPYYLAEAAAVLLISASRLSPKVFSRVSDSVRASQAISVQRTTLNLLTVLELA